MNKTSLESFYNSLLPALWEELFFFIPNSEILNEFFNNTENFDFQKYRNKILVIDYFEGPIICLPDRDNTRGISKGYALKKNIYQLLQKKNNSDEVEFNYILEQYYEQVESLFYITYWMNENLTQVYPLNEPIKGLFQMQFNYYGTHFKTLLKHFYPNKEEVPEGNLNLVRIIETSFPKLYEHYNKREIKKEQAGTLILQDDHLKKKATISKNEPVTKKPPIITEKEAETILLKRIFHVIP